MSIAQYGLESGWGAHMPPCSNNPFGIKARRGEPCVVTETGEHLHGHDVRINQSFRKFSGMTEAFDRHAELLATAPVYAHAHAYEHPGEDDAYVGAIAIHYATDPDYARKILAIMHGSNLAQYDVVA